MNGALTVGPGFTTEVFDESVLNATSRIDVVAGGGGDAQLHLWDAFAAVASNATTGTLVVRSTDGDSGHKATVIIEDATRVTAGTVKIGDTGGVTANGNPLSSVIVDESRAGMGASLLKVTDSLIIGGNGAGSLIVDGGEVNAQGVQTIVGQNDGSLGILSVTGRNAPLVSAGALKTSSSSATTERGELRSPTPTRWRASRARVRSSDAEGAARAR